MVKFNWEFWRTYHEQAQAPDKDFIALLFLLPKFNFGIQLAEFNRRCEIAFETLCVHQKCNVSHSCWEGNYPWRAQQGEEYRGSRGDQHDKNGLGRGTRKELWSIFPKLQARAQLRLAHFKIFISRGKPLDTTRSRRNAVLGNETGRYRVGRRKTNVRLQHKAVLRRVRPLHSGRLGLQLRCGLRHNVLQQRGGARRQRVGDSDVGGLPVRPAWKRLRVEALRARWKLHQLSGVCVKSLHQEIMRQLNVRPASSGNYLFGHRFSAFLYVNQSCFYNSFAVDNTMN